MLVLLHPPPQVIGGIYLAAFESGSFGSPATLPRQFSRVCLPNPDAAENEACKSVSAVIGRTFGAASGAACQRWFAVLVPLCMP